MEIILNLSKESINSFEKDENFTKFSSNHKISVLSDNKISTKLPIISESDFLKTIKNLKDFKYKRIIHKLENDDYNFDTLQYPKNLITYSKSQIIIIVENGVKRIIVNSDGLNILMHYIDEILKVNSSYKRIMLKNYKTISNKVEYYNLDNYVGNVISAVTREISKKQVSRLVKSATYNGYRVILEDKNDKWKNFGTKITCLLKGLKYLEDDDIAILIDGTDTFINTPDLVDNYKKFGTDIVVSGERKLWYNNKKLKYDYDIVKDFFTKNIKGRDIFPNAGFFMGKVKSLKEALQPLSNCVDDQYEFITLLYEARNTLSNGKLFINNGTISVSIDTKSKLIGTISNYLVDKKKDVSQADYSKLFLPGSRIEVYDLSINASKSIPIKRGNITKYRGERLEFQYNYDVNGYRIGKTYPAAFHYPNKNNDIFNLMYAQVYDDTTSVSNEDTSMWNYVIFVFFILLITFSILFLIYAISDHYIKKL